MQSGKMQKSHQFSLDLVVLYIPETPRPIKSIVGEMVLKHYASALIILVFILKITIAFIKPPIIKDAIVAAVKGSRTQQLYLPSFDKGCV
jgi:hypothetical protein